MNATHMKAAQALPADALAPSGATLAPKLWALVPCAGAGQRAGGAQPKQYQRLAGFALVEHTLAALLKVQGWAAVVVVTAPGDSVQPGRGHPLVGVRAVGGPTRAETVRNGLQQLLLEGADANDWVLVHDAARCLVAPEAIERLITTCQGDAVGGLLATPLVDTLKQQTTAPDLRVGTTLARDGKWLAQTPQMFRIGPLVAALDNAKAAGDATVTDEASAMERVGHQPLLVDGGTLNIKVTYPQDFELAEAVLRYRQGANQETRP
jgi:2-C-methyl-D-erythritol 4-phosphate cytidylyltransferase